MTDGNEYFCSACMRPCDPVYTGTASYTGSMKFNKKTRRILDEIDNTKWYQFGKRRRLYKLIK